MHPAVRRSRGEIEELATKQVLWSAVSVGSMAMWTCNFKRNGVPTAETRTSLEKYQMIQTARVPGWYFFDVGDHHVFWTASVHSAS